jgi:hypothetical protein
VESVMARWFYRGKWWLDSKLEGERRTYFRLSCSKLAAAKPEIRRRMNLHAAIYNGGVAAQPAAERIVEVFQRTREGVETWVLSGVVD